MVEPGINSPNSIPKFRCGREKSISSAQGRSTPVVSNDLLHRQLGSKLIPTPHRDYFQLLGTADRRTLQLADRQSLDLVFPALAPGVA